MKCNCLQGVNEDLRRATGDPEAWVQTSLTGSDGKLETLPYMNATYRKRKKDGSFASKKEKIAIFPHFCPFCGTSLVNKTIDDEIIEIGLKGYQP